MATLATVLLRALKAHGAREIFGIPGDFVLPFYKAIEQSRILAHYELSHEPAVGFAADAAARFMAASASRSSHMAPEPSMSSTRLLAPMPNALQWW
jgi:thiamine pyrophosphate-dependent acetolactate synthase large subunit-like protein